MIFIQAIAIYDTNFNLEMELRYKVHSEHYDQNLLDFRPQCVTVIYRFKSDYHLCLEYDLITLEIRFACYLSFASCR